MSDSVITLFDEHNARHILQPRQEVLLNIKRELKGLVTVTEKIEKKVKERD